MGRRLVMVFIAVQVVIPVIGLVARWTGPMCYVRFSWQMFSCPVG